MTTVIHAVADHRKRLEKEDKKTLDQIEAIRKKSKWPCFNFSENLFVKCYIQYGKR